MVRKKIVKLAFSQILEKKIQQQDLTLNDVAVIAGTTKSVVHGWICGSHLYDLRAVAKVSELLKVPFYNLLFGHDDPVILKHALIDHGRETSRALRSSFSTNDFSDVARVVFDSFIAELSKMSSEDNQDH